MRKAEGKTRGKKREGRFVSLEKERVSVLRGRRGREARESSERSVEPTREGYGTASGVHSRAHAASPLKRERSRARATRYRARVRVQSRSTRAGETANEYRRPLGGRCDQSARSASCVKAERGLFAYICVFIIQFANTWQKWSLSARRLDLPGSTEPARTTGRWSQKVGAGQRRDIGR